MEITGPNIDGFIHATAADPEGGAAPAPGLVNAVGQWGTQPCIELRDQVEVFSLSQARWIPGEVTQVVEAFVAVVTYGDPGAQRFQKRVDLRDAKVIRPRADALDNLRAKCAAGHTLERERPVLCAFVTFNELIARAAVVDLYGPSTNLPPLLHRCLRRCRRRAPPLPEEGAAGGADAGGAQQPQGGDGAAATPSSQQWRTWPSRGPRLSPAENLASLQHEAARRRDADEREKERALAVLFPAGQGARTRRAASDVHELV